MTRLATILFLIANCQLSIANAQLMPPTQVDTGWMMADVTAPKQQVVAQPAVNLVWDTGLEASTNLLADWTVICGFPAQATNRLSLPRADIMFFRKWEAETNRF
jgi:uncharacterized protein YmfQ (DUF2313 family)